MSFFGFDTNLPRDAPNQSSASRGMFESHDPFAGLSRGQDRDAGVTLDFEETYDGLGQQLEESGDTFNDDTFGGDEPVTRESVGRDFDFAGQTAGVRDTLLEEQVLHQARNPIRQTQLGQKPARSGYEAYRQPEYIPKLEADASIWGNVIASRSNEPAPAPVATPSKMLSLEEVEAQMRSQARPAAPPKQDSFAQTQGLKNMLGLGRNAASPAQQPMLQQQRSPQILQRPQVQPQDPQLQQLQQDPNLRAPQILQRQHSPLQQMQQQGSPAQQPGRPLSQTFDGRQAQPPMGYPLPPHLMQQQAPPVQAPRGPAMQQMGHARGPSYNGPPVTHPQQLAQMSGPEREAFLAEEAKRAKRNHKIFLLSKNNGLMTPQDKNFITRIQLQQLLTATGGVSQEPSGGDPLAEDFYYQVYAQIRGPPRSGPGQPLNQFAQTYLFQTGGGNRYGYGRSRHHPRGGNGGHGGNADNHVARMEQQVARAVEAAKARPKNKQLTMEGSLGKIAFSNSKTPRPLLNIKRPDTPSVAANLPSKPADRKTALRNVEALYTVLMQLEDHERRLPPPPNEESPPEVIEGHMRWRREMQVLNQRLWESSKVMEPIQPRYVGSSITYRSNLSH
jgi:DNA topoisomerase 2-associated protein PAT1